MQVLAAAAPPRFPKRNLDPAEDAQKTAGHRPAVLVFGDCAKSPTNRARRDWEPFTGPALERWFRAKLAESGEWTRIGSWWDRKGENEIDIVAENELAGRAAFFEVKRDARRFDEGALRRKADAFLAATGAFRGYDLSFGGLSLADM